MTAERASSDEIRKRIEPTLNKVAVDGLRAWLRSIDLPSAAYSRAAITELVSKQIASGQLDEGALESALIGFEEASDMRIHLFRMDELPSGKPEKWLPTRLLKAGFALANTRIFAGEKVKPMSPVYAQLEGGLLRVKWVEQQEQSKMNDRGDGVILKPVFMSVYICRWPNGDISLVSGNNRLTIDHVLDEVGNPDDAEMIRIKHPVAVHLRFKNDFPKCEAITECLEFGGIDERSYWDLCKAYPVLSEVLFKDNPTEEEIAAAAEHERNRIEPEASDLPNDPVETAIQFQMDMPKRL